MKRVLSTAVFALFAVGFGCSSSDDTAGTTPKKDTGVTDGTSNVDAGDDTNTVDSSTTTDTSTTDSTTPTGCTTDIHAGDECDMVKQDCADVASTCEYDTTAMHNKCAKRATGSATKGEACSTSADCDKGLFCYSKHCAPACCPGDNSVCGGTGGACDLAITDPTSMAVIYHVCSYSAKCNPFKYDCPTDEVCLFSEEPDAFKCAAPSTGSAGIGVKPGVSCKYVNDCGESQLCTELTMGGDASGTGGKCYAFCWLMTPAGFMPGTTPGSKFPANGTCTVGGVNYGTCTSVGGIGGGLGLCVK